MSDLQRRLSELQKQLQTEGIKVTLTPTPAGMVIEGAPADRYLAKHELKKRRIKTV